MPYMTLPRRFLSDSTYFVTRRCSQRKFFLKPTKKTTQIFLYCLGVAAKKYGVFIHAVIVMSNHYHVVFTDPHAKAAEFYGWVHKYVSKAVNASLGRWENMWSSEKPSVITVNEPKTVLDKIIYTICNPVEARLVARAKHWPGVLLYKASHSQRVERPKVYFRKDGDMPDEVELMIVRPPQYADISQEEYEELIEREVTAREEKIHKEMKSKGQSFLGVHEIMRQSHNSSPKSYAKRRGFNPQIAGKNKWLRLEAIQRHKEFQFEYREAYKRWRKGDRDVVFPAGTYALRVFCGVKCHPG